MESPKFVQITCSSAAQTGHLAGQVRSDLYALDEAGHVWRYNGKDSWMQLPDLRVDAKRSPLKQQG